MRTYGQYCPVARGGEIFAERWTPIILRNILWGCQTFNDISAGAPGLSRALLVRRLRELEQAGVLKKRSKPNGHGSIYEPTQAGRALEVVIMHLGLWAEQWTDVQPEHSDPAVVLWSWSRLYLRRDSLPDRRVVVRFEFIRRERKQRLWLLIDHREGELCAFDPGFGDDLLVAIDDPVSFARWHLGQLRWELAVKAGAIAVSGPADLRRALPTWNTRPDIGHQMHAMITANGSV